METMSDKEWFESNSVLKNINSDVVMDKEEKDKLLYESIVSKFIMSGQDILNLPHEPNDYLIENFLWKDDVAFVLGREKACKSIFTSQEAMSLTCGESFLQSFEVARKLKVLYVQAEGSLGDTKDRLTSSLKKDGLMWDANNWAHCFPPALALDTEDGYQMFRAGVIDSGFKPEVVIIDPLYMAMEGDLIDNKAVRSFCRNIRKLKKEWMCSFIIVHHEHRPKTDVKGYTIDEGDNAIFGSSMLKNFASHVLRISIVNERGNPMAEDKEGSSIYRKVVCSTQRNGNVVKSVMLVLNQDPLMFEVMDKATNGTEQSVYMSLKQHGPSTYDMIAQNTGLKLGTVRNSICRMRRRGTVKNHHKEGLHVYLEAV
jgi:hypothetical protein